MESLVLPPEERLPKEYFNKVWGLAAQIRMSVMQYERTVGLRDFIAPIYWLGGFARAIRCRDKGWLPRVTPIGIARMNGSEEGAQLHAVVMFSGYWADPYLRQGCLFALQPLSGDPCNDMGHLDAVPKGFLGLEDSSLACEFHLDQTGQPSFNVYGGKWIHVTHVNAFVQEDVDPRASSIVLLDSDDWGEVDDGLYYKLGKLACSLDCI